MYNIATQQPDGTIADANWTNFGGKKVAPDAVDILDEMAAMPMGSKRDEFYAANEEAIMAAFSARAKSGK